MYAKNAKRSNRSNSARMAIHINVQKILFIIRDFQIAKRNDIILPGLRNYFGNHPMSDENCF